VRILIVEDSNEYRRHLLKTLRPRGYEVYVATNGIEGFEMVKAKNYIDVIITDLQMPIMDGISMCQEIKKRLKSKKIPPILMLTTEANKEIKKQGTQAGVARWLLKPAKNEMLFKMIHHLCPHG
jgi:two-component system chemotaxis response regulator CheY